MFTFGRGRCWPYTAATASIIVRPALTSRPLMARAWATKWFTELDIVDITTVWWAWRCRYSRGALRSTHRMLLPAGWVVG